jgi:uncharacterized protein YggE
VKRLFFILLALGALAPCALGQVSGNRNYGSRGTDRRTPPNAGLISNGNDQFIEAYVLLNQPADEFVAVFGVAQEGQTAAESNQKVNARIEQFLSAAGKLGVARGDTFVDFITQNRVYNFATAADATIRETLSGFETKKTVSVRYKDKNLLEQFTSAAAQASIFDLIKVDYVVNDPAKIRGRLFDEAVRVVKQKEENYVRSLGLAIRRHSIAQETYNTFYPAELYQTYNAFETGAVEQNYDARTRVIRERKGSTSFLEPLDRSAFDVVVNPVGIEPLVQCTLYLRVKYTLAP